MIDILKEAVKEIAGFLLVVSILENLIQNEKFRKYLKMTAGIVMILIIFQPLNKILGNDYNYFEMFTVKEYEKDIQEMEKSLSDVNKSASKDVISQYKLYMEEKVERELINEGFEIDEVTVELYVNEESMVELDKMTIRYDNANHPNLIHVGNDISNIDAKKTYLKKYVANLYGISEKNIEII